MKFSDNQVVSVIYTNYRGEKSKRKIVPIKIWFGSTEYHPEAQWILDAYDLDKNALRSFALKEINSWQ